MKTTTFISVFLLLAVLFASPSCSDDETIENAGNRMMNDVLYVKPTGDDNNTGNSWATAFQTLQKALTVAQAGNQIWVAAGTYKPTVTHGGGSNRYMTFFIDKDIKIYGGFNGTENHLHLRDWVAHPTILSGDIGTAGNNGDNCYHVVWIENCSNAMRLDGFTIEKGNANGSGNQSADIGGGIFNDGTSGISNPIINNCTFSGNSGYFGGGMYNDASNGECSPSLTNCTFSNNSALTDGGGMYNKGGGGESNPTLVKCTFSGNSASGNGGGVFNDGLSGECSPSLVSCTFSGNSTVDGDGGGMYNKGDNGTSSPVLTNCGFSGNSAGSDGGGVYNFAAAGGTSSPVLLNCFFSGNAANADGGGICNYGNGGACNPTLTNCSLSGNAAGGEGGGFFNFGDAGGSGSPNLFNCILWGNNDEMVNVNNANPTFEYAIVQGGCPAFANCSNVFNANPLFISQPPFANAPTTAGDLHLQAASPAINAGTSNGAPVRDFDGDARPQGAGYDLGYDERLSACPSSNIIYVKASASGANNGSSWTNAFNGLQHAIDLGCACPGVEQIWVASATYKPVAIPVDLTGGGTERHRTFYIDCDVEIYGGFVGTETMLSQRNWETNTTTLSGDIGVPSIRADNCYHVVWINQRTSAMRLDGFRIECGNADGINELDDAGGGILNNGSFGSSNPTIANCYFFFNEAEKGGAMVNAGAYGVSNPNLNNCTFFFNTASSSGGAMYNFSYGGTSSPTLLDCDFISNGNGATFAGGAIYNEGYFGTSSPSFTNCSFTGNRATYGGGIVNQGESGDCSPVWTNCVFSGNAAIYYGGAMFNIYPDCSPSLSNCSFSGNSVTLTVIGGALANFNANTTLQNCILWGNSSEIDTANGGEVTVTNSIVQGGYAGTGNLDVNPLFISQPDYNDAPTIAGNLRLQACSPAADAGNDAANSTTTDLDGNPRKVDAITGGQMIDMGAYEYQGDLDADNDTYTYCGGIDCDDANANIHPGATEVCNGTDDDCDGQVDEGVLITFYADADNDGYGNPVVTTLACAAPAGFVANDDDCNDANPAIHPGAMEICNGVDDDCNGSPESALTTWTGAGDGMNWSDGGNWSDGFVPLTCQDVAIPAAGNVTVPAGFNAVGKTLDVAVGAILQVNATATVTIQN